MTRSKPAWLISVGASAEHVAAILKARSMGFAVVAADANPKAPGLQVADEGIVADLRDERAIVSIARRYGVSGTLPIPIGRLLLTQAAIQDALGLAGVTRAAALNCVDKAAFYECVAAAGVAVPRQVRAGSAADLKAWSVPIDQFPVVLKPRFGSGSAGVQVLTSSRDWFRWRERADQRCYADGVLVQSFVGGLSLGVDGAVREGVVRVTLIREKVLTPAPNRVELSYRAPARLPAVADEAVLRILERALRSLGILDSVFHADIVWTAGNQPVLIELSARPSGLAIASQMVPACTGVDFLREAILLQMGQTPGFRPSTLQPTLLHYFSHPRGVVRLVPSVADLLALPHVIAAHIGLRPGQVLRSPATIDDLIGNGYVLIRAAASEILDATLPEVLSLFDIEGCRDVA